jgi:hypothetical protein
VSGRAEPANQYASHQKAGGVGGLCLVLDGASTNPNYPDNNNSYPDATDDYYFPLMDYPSRWSGSAKMPARNDMPNSSARQCMGNVTGYRKAAANEVVGSLRSVVNPTPPKANP